MAGVPWEVDDTQQWVPWEVDDTQQPQEPRGLASFMRPYKVGGVDINPIPGAYGMAEAATSVATAIPAALISSAAGAAQDLITGKPPTKPLLTSWQPRTEAGRTQLEMLGEFLNKSGIASLPPVLGVSGVAQLPSRMNLQQAISPITSRLAESRAAKAAALADESRLNAPRIEALKAAQETGAVVFPTAVSSGLGTGTVESISGKEMVEQSMMAKNQPIAQSLVRKDLGIPVSQPLVGSVYDDIRSRPDVVEPYQTAAKLPTVAVDDVFRNEVSSLNRLSGFSDEVKDVLKSDRVEALTGKIQNIDALSGDEALALIRDFRDKSKNLHRQINQGTGGADAAESALVKVYDDAADIVENQLERRAAGDSNLVSRLRNARKTIAKTYQYEKATDLGTGNIDARVFAKRLKEGQPIEGNMRMLGQIAGQFPDAFGVPGMRSIHTMGQGSAGGVQSLVQYPIRRMAAGSLTSDFIQNKLRATKDFRPLREQMGYERDVPTRKIPINKDIPYNTFPPVPGSMVIPQSWREGINAAMERRGLPAMSEDLLPHGAGGAVIVPQAGRAPLPQLPPSDAMPPLMPVPRNQVVGVSEPIGIPDQLLPLSEQYPQGIPIGAAEGRMPQPSTPLPRLYQDNPLIQMADEQPRGKLSDLGESIPFDSRLEVLNSPIMVEATNAFIDEAAGLKAAIAAETNGFKKSTLEAKLRGTENRFMAGLKEMGIRSEAEARNLMRKVYETGGETQRGIIKTKSLKDLMP